MGEEENRSADILSLAPEACDDEHLMQVIEGCQHDSIVTGQ